MKRFQSSYDLLRSGREEGGETETEEETPIRSQTDAAKKIKIFILVFVSFGYYLCFV